MNKREAKIYALEVASGILTASCDTMEVEPELSDDDHTKIITELHHIANSLREVARYERLKERDKRG